MKITLEVADDGKILHAEVTKDDRSVTTTTAFNRLYDRDHGMIFGIQTLNNYEWNIIDKVVKVLDNALNRYMPEERDLVEENLVYDEKGLYTLSRSQVSKVEMKAICEDVDFEVNKNNGVVTVKRVGPPSQIALQYGYKGRRKY
ncbi:hypothetical protein KAR91_54920 [Candidatus Pacearchaeota archaeon]|nr:hypothetical protein [Candidatus Pacearchaeota archaeon]